MAVRIEPTIWPRIVRFSWFAWKTILFVHISSIDVEVLDDKHKPDDACGTLQLTVSIEWIRAPQKGPCFWGAHGNMTPASNCSWWPGGCIHQSEFPTGCVFGSLCRRHPKTYGQVSFSNLENGFIQVPLESKFGRASKDNNIIGFVGTWCENVSCEYLTRLTATI